MAPMVINGRLVEGRAKPAELLEQLTPDHYRRAYDAGMNLSLWLERQDPSNEYRDGLDAFERLMYVADIVTRSRPEIGLWASTPKDMEDAGDQVRLLFPELVARFWRSATTGKDPSTRALYTSSDDLPGSIARPWAEAVDARWSSRRKAPIMLQDIVAINTGIDTDAYKAYYLTTDDAETRMSRVAELGEIPMSKLTGGDNMIRLKKYGRGIAQSYESLRRVRIDKIRLWVERLAIINEMDKVSEAINVLVSGDGNSNTAATNWRAVTDLDSAATGKAVTLRAWLAFKMKFFPTYNLTHIIGAEGDILKLLLVNIGSSGASVPTYLSDVTGEPGYSNRLRDGVVYGLTPDGPTDKFVGIDASAALERVVEVGSEINEIERWATRQAQAIVMSVVEGFAIFDSGANKTLELQTS